MLEQLKSAGRGRLVGRAFRVSCRIAMEDGGVREVESREFYFICKIALLLVFR